MKNDDQCCQEQRIVRAPGLEPADIWQTRVWNALSFQPAPEILVGNEDAEPIEYGEDGDEADKIIEHNRRHLGRIHVCQSDKERWSYDRVYGDAGLCSLCEYLRSLPISC